jgi:16S rRNA (uracil1498-N3)-methyltransferase
MTTPFAGQRRTGWRTFVQQRLRALIGRIEAQDNFFSAESQRVSANLARAPSAADNRAVIRRVHVDSLPHAGPVRLDQAQAHHLRDVLRLKAGDEIEAFDDAGNIASAIIERCDELEVYLQIGDLRARQPAAEIVIASAVPKGDRADWMIEKLSELGVSRFIPLITARSVVVPAGQNKRQRWIRIATESAKQSRRAGVMKIEEATDFRDAIAAKPPAGTTRFYLSTEPGTSPILDIRQSTIDNRHFFIGPEGGWTDGEIEQFRAAGLTGLRLTGTILRVETAAIAAAALVACLLSMGTPSHS